MMVPYIATSAFWQVWHVQQVRASLGSDYWLCSSASKDLWRSRASCNLNREAIR